jgi:anti-anti-sigma regulatory factor
VSVDIGLDRDHRIALVTVRGDLTAANAPVVSGTIAALVTDDGYDVVVDLTEGGTILAGGVRALRRSSDLAHEHHRELRVACPPSSAIRPALLLAHLDEQLGVYDSLDAAMERSLAVG